MGAVIILFLFVGLGALVFYLVEKQNETAISVTDSFFLAAQTVTTVRYKHFYLPKPSDIRVFIVSV